MIAHLFRLIWNRKRSQGLVLGEIAVSFLVLCMVCTTIAYFVHNTRRPLGFAWQDVWRVHMDYGEYQSADEEGRRALWDRLQRLEQEVRSLEGVEAAALMNNVPYSNSTSSWSMSVHGRQVEMLFGVGAPQAVDVLRLQLATGRWFSPGDESLDWVPMVINRELARTLFGQDSPLGESLPRFDESGRPQARPADEPDYRVIGVLSDYRRDGELSASPLVTFTPIRPTPHHWPTDRLMIRTRAGTTAAFEENLSRRLHELAPDWSFDVRAMTSERNDALRRRLLPLVIGGTAAGFLLIMVAMGLMGVLWLNVTRRTRELGLRRAMGATASGVRLQILGELVALTTVAVALGALVFLQAPLLGIAGWVSWQVYAVGIVGSLLILYTLVVLCGLYPSWLATRVHPAQALHYE